MKIKKLQVRNFRNLKKIDYYSKEGLNIFVGDNAQGKTNLLESIFVLATGNSFRSATDVNLVNYDAEEYVIKINYDILERSLEATLHYKKNSHKIAMINNKKSAQNHKDKLQVVLFTPDDLFLVKGSPAKRRAFLDFILKQISNEYLFNIDNYSTILKKRNYMLKNEQTNGESFKIVNDIFIENAVRIIIQRINFINLLDEIIQPIYREINYYRNNLKIRYAISFKIDSHKINMNVLQVALQNYIEKNIQEEIHRKKTLVGPHLDDIHFYQDGRLARVFASQGQQRNIAISLKLAEMYAFNRVKKYYPVFLLDEVLSELDEEKRHLLIKYLQQSPFQTFLTSVNMEEMELIKGMRLIVKDGNLF